MTKNKKIFAACALFVVVAAAAGFAVNVNGSIVNAFTGFQYNGSAPSNHVLCGNGTNYVDNASCAISVASATTASTATALAATPTQCGGGTPLATGIAANGNANCTAIGPATHVTSHPTQSYGTVYQNTGTTPLFVTVYFTDQSACTVAAYTDSSSPPTTLYSEASIVSGGAYDAFNHVDFWVQPGDYYRTVKITGTVCAYVGTTTFQ